MTETLRHLPVTATIAVLAVLAALTRPAIDDEPDRADGGFTTIEWVVIALGLFLVAGVAVAAITAAVNGRLSQIV